MATDVFLTDIDFHAQKFKSCTIPTSIGGGITLSAGPPVGSTTLAQVDGDVTYSFPEVKCKLPGVFRVSGTGKVLGLKVATAYIQYTTYNVLTFGSHFGLGVPDFAQFALDFNGGVNIPKKKFFAEGKANLTVVGVGLPDQKGSSLTMASASAAASCRSSLTSGSTRAASTYHYGEKITADNIDYPGCAGDFEGIEKGAFALKARAAGASGGFGFKVGAGAPAVKVFVQGANAAPGVAHHGPRRPARGLFLHAPHVPRRAPASCSRPSSRSTARSSASTGRRPARGRWPPSPGRRSPRWPPSDGLPTPSPMAGCVRGRGLWTQTTDFRVKPIAGQTVSVRSRVPASGPCLAG